MKKDAHSQATVNHETPASLEEVLLSKPAAFFALLHRYRKRILFSIVILAHTAGALTSVEAIMNTRSSQGAVAWAISLNLFPYAVVPLYWAFGHTEMEGYVVERWSDHAKFEHLAEILRQSLEDGNLSVEYYTQRGRVLGAFNDLSLTRGNTVELLIDGQTTFEAMFEAIDNAEVYILVQFYIVRDDDLGGRLKDKLIAKSREGVKVYLLYDQIGSLFLSESYTRELIDNGVQVEAFSTHRRVGRKYQLNFRNHRKLVVVDGKTGFAGGFNVGDEYLGHHERLAPWRDTHLRVVGPIVQQMQVSFSEDWYWATEDVLEHLDWIARPSDAGGDQHALYLATGPADPLETCSLFFLAVINSAENRLWLASPYFVPDTQIVSALQLAALRGVDVRILLPGITDSKLVYYSSFSYLPEIELAGIKPYRYQRGFLHQKVILVDDDFAVVGSANLDNRSFRLNFESIVAVKDEKFAAEVAAMLKEDFDNSSLTSAAVLENKSFFFRLKTRVSRLLAPIQ